MAVEAKRGCGYRKIGGIYLVGGGIGIPCDRLPLELGTCPCCGEGIRQAMGWRWVDVAKLVQGKHLVDSKTTFNITVTGPLQVPCGEEKTCLFCGNPEAMGRAGLLWVGGKFYPTPDEFLKEGLTQGFSKRIRAVPHGFEIGKTYVLLAHPKAVPAPFALTPEELPNATPGIFYIWKPERVEKILPESARNSEEAESLENRGISPVFVPDDDKDHQGSVWDKKETD